MSLKSDDAILPLYANIYSQALQYNIILVLFSSITVTCGVIHHDLALDTQEAIDTVLGNKFREEGMLSKEFETAHNLLLTTNSESEFLFHLLMMKHPKLALVLLATINIPKHSSSDNIFKYAKAIKNYLFCQSIDQRT